MEKKKPYPFKYDECVCTKNTLSFIKAMLRLSNKLQSLVAQLTYNIHY